MEKLRYVFKKYYRYLLQKTCVGHDGDHWHSQDGSCNLQGGVPRTHIAVVEGKNCAVVEGKNWTTICT